MTSERLSTKTIAQEAVVLLVNKFGAEALWDDEPIASPYRLRAYLPTPGSLQSLEDYSAKQIEPAVRSIARRLKRTRLKVRPGLAPPKNAEGFVERYAGVEALTVWDYDLLRDREFVQINVLAA